jgi:molybdate transport system regulatory protein
MRKKLRPVFYLALEDERKVPVIDQVDARLLRFISEYGSISEAAKELGISFRSAWSRISALEKRTGTILVRRKSGGKMGGGSQLTNEGVQLLKNFRRIRKYIFNVLDDSYFWQHAGYKLSARNRVRVKVIGIERGEITSMVKMQIIEKARITSIISTEAVDELGLKEGDEVHAIIKATEVIIGKE